MICTLDFVQGTPFSTTMANLRGALQKYTFLYCKSPVSLCNFQIILLTDKALRRTKGVCFQLMIAAAKGGESRASLHVLSGSLAG